MELTYTQCGDYLIPNLTLPPGVIVTNENLAASFAALSGRLSQLSRGE